MERPSSADGHHPTAWVGWRPISNHMQADPRRRPCTSSSTTPCPDWTMLLSAGRAGSVPSGSTAACSGSCCFRSCGLRRCSSDHRIPAFTIAGNRSQNRGMETNRHRRRVRSISPGGRLSPAVLHHDLPWRSGSARSRESNALGGTYPRVRPGTGPRQFLINRHRGAGGVLPGGCRARKRRYAPQPLAASQRRADRADQSIGVALPRDAGIAARSAPDSIKPAGQLSGSAP